MQSILDFHIGSHIRKEVERQDRTVAWLARQINCSRTNVYKIFRKENLDVRLLARISHALEHDFFRDLSKLL